MFDKKFNKGSFSPIKGLMMLMMIILIMAVMGGIVMFLWNAIIPDVTGFKPLTFWQAVGLLALFKILFGGFGGNRNRWNKKKRRVKNRWREKWMNLSDEEREQAKEKWKNYCDRRKRD